MKNASQRRDSSIVPEDKSEGSPEDDEAQSILGRDRRSILSGLEEQEEVENNSAYSSIEIGKKKKDQNPDTVF